MTLFYFNIIFLFIMFQVFSSSIFDIVMINYEFMHMFTKRLIQYSSRLSGSQYVSVVLRYCMSTNALYMLGSVLDHRRGNNPVESFVTHTSYIELVEPGCRGIV
jgi:hypothetical protein